MIYRNVELFNVEEVKETADKTGVILYRFPSDVVDAIKDRGAYMSRANTGCEIRFVSSAKTIWLTMGAIAHNVGVTVFCGDMVYEKRIIEAGKRTTLELKYNTCFDKIDEEILSDMDGRFPLNLWRVYINSEESHCIFYDIEGLDGIIRPPLATEVPEKKWLAYGSSITHGCWTIDTSNSYIQHAAKKLGVDVMCKGMAGACQCEREMADYIKNADWDFATLELGVNMMGRKTKDFKKRVDYMIHSVHESNPGKKVFIITPFPNCHSAGKDKDSFDKHNDYTKILKEIVNEINSENLIVIDGGSILDSYSYLCYDFVHPSEYGHVRMGENLSEILKKYL